MKKQRGRPTQASLKEKLEAVAPEVTAETPVEASPQQPRPDPSNRTKRRRVSAVGGAASGGKLGYMGDLDPNYHYRICNDEGTNIEEMKSFGYDVCTGDEVKFKSSNAIKSGTSQEVVVDRATGKKGILMRQPIEFHNEDNDARAAMISKGEESMFRNLKTDEGRYGGIENTSSLSKKLDS